MMRRTGKRDLLLKTATEGTGGGARTKSGMLGLSGIAAVLPEKMQGLLNWTVRVGKNHCVSVERLVTDAMPGGYDEDISLAPLNHKILTGSRRDHPAALSLDWHKDCRIV